jgi:YebC/PmpR family DNA-binding regulatory protein
VGAQWKNQNKSQNANRKGAVVSKLAKEIIVAAKMGGADMDHNARLRAAVESARKQSVTRDTIERAIKKGAGLLDEPVNYESVIYEGFAPHQVALVVECLTDNKNRTASSLRGLFKKGQLGSSGSVMWMFDHLGVIEATHKDKSIDIEGAAIEAGAQNVEALTADETGDTDLGARFFCDTTDLIAVNKSLAATGWTISLCEMNYIAKSFPELDETQRAEVGTFLNEIDDDDDVHRVYAALK